jgi:hypothetical protein
VNAFISATEHLPKPNSALIWDDLTEKLKGFPQNQEAGIALLDPIRRAGIKASIHPSATQSIKQGGGRKR